MRIWAIQDAKARFSEFLESCLAQGPQMVTKRGYEVAMLVPVDAWRRLQAAARSSLKQLLLSDQGRTALLVPRRARARRRAAAPAQCALHQEAARDTHFSEVSEPGQMADLRPGFPRNVGVLGFLLGFWALLLRRQDANKHD